MVYCFEGYCRLNELPKNAGFSGHFVENQLGRRTSNSQRMLILSIGIRTYVFRFSSPQIGSNQSTFGVNS
jgi:hypothetical protein